MARSIDVTLAGLEWMAEEQRAERERIASTMPNRTRDLMARQRAERMAAREAKAFRPSDAELVTTLLGMREIELPTV